LNAFYQEHRYHADAFLHRQDFFAKRNIMALVLEVPNHLIGDGKIHGWVTTSLFGHAPEMQIQRWGLPLITHVFLSASDQLKDKFNTSTAAITRGTLRRKAFARSIYTDDRRGLAIPLAAGAADPCAYSPIGIN